jgi:hypothetical protein
VRDLLRAEVVWLGDRDDRGRRELDKVLGRPRPVRLAPRVLAERILPQPASRRVDGTRNRSPLRSARLWVEFTATRKTSAQVGIRANSRNSLSPLGAPVFSSSPRPHLLVERWIGAWKGEVNPEE